MQFDVNLNATVEIDDDVWQGIIEAYIDPDALDPEEAREEAKEEAILELQSDLEGAELDSYYGRAWVCWADNLTPM